MKIELNKKIEYKTIKIGKEKVLVRPFLFTNEKLLISDICCKRFYENKENKTSMHLIFLMYNMLVSSLCLNLEIEGIKHKIKKDKLFEISIDLKDEDIEKFEIMNLNGILKENICNYTETWNNVVEDIRNYKTINDFLENFQDKLPSEDGQKKIIDDIKTIVEDFGSKNPRATKDSAIKEIRDEIKKENKKK